MKNLLDTPFSNYFKLPQFTILPKKDEEYMNEQPYEHSGEPLGSGIAWKLILELFAGHTAHRDEIKEGVMNEHLERGGKRPTAKTDRIAMALSNLAEDQRAEKREGNYWKIFSSSATEKELVEPSLSPEKTIDSGSGSVYVYYYPNYRHFAESEGKTAWLCKIGRTERGVDIRIKEQTTGMPEKPVVSLAIRTDKPKVLENIIHNILDYYGKKQDGSKKEWFITSPSEVENLYRNCGAANEQTLLRDTGEDNLDETN